MRGIQKQLEVLAHAYSEKLHQKIRTRTDFLMKLDNTAHYLIYQVLGISNDEGRLIDEYQNTGRFLYKYAGSFLEAAAKICLQSAYPAGGTTRINNPFGQRPKTFEIDFLHEQDALEIKWRDATTDGDHITKEHIRVRAIQSCGYKPIRVMFYYPQREQAIRIQQTLKTLYAGVSGEYYAGDEAWNFLLQYTKIDLKSILAKIAQRNFKNENQ